MQTKISRYCEGIIEAAWLAAVILVPIYFNIYSSRIFEPDKIAILRSLAVLILVSWIVKLISQGESHGISKSNRPEAFNSVINIPLIILVIALAIIYIISTIFSVTPRISFWGSYQRLQGTYTTFSYLIIFLAIIGNLRRKDQVDRLVTTIVLASLPVALYGILQRYQIDPIPWGGDTSRRIAANMGNSIFVAAYLIMVFPLTAGRIVQSFSEILKSEKNIWSQMARSTVYVFIGAIQLLAIYMSGSRGPALGLLAGSFFLMVLLSLYWRKRWLTFGIIGTTVFVGVFLLVFNLPGGPFEGLKDSPAIGRFGLLLDAESNSALVRKYIWQGAADLVTPHEPIEFPDGSKDPFNALRILIGYGPESMYVAYNPFYVPDLAQVERRNASPDRSHNESWDALVITGMLGFLVYLSLFSLVLYYGLKWVGIIANNRQRNLFLTLLTAGGVVGAAGFSFWRGMEYFGVGLPFGMLMGFLSYLTITAIFSSTKKLPEDDPSFRSITLIVIIAGIVSHFVEINFGIAIASTRTYFWIYSALLICVGYILPRYQEIVFTSSWESDQVESVNQTRKKRRYRGPSRSDLVNTDSQILNWLPIAMIVSITMSTLGYDYITNPNGYKNTIEVLWHSVTHLPNREDALSFGILALILTSWLMMSVVYAVESTPKQSGRSIWQAILWILLVSAGFTILYWLWHANSLAAVARNVATNVNSVLEQVGRYEALLAKFYIFVAAMIFILAYFLSEKRLDKRGKISGISLIAILLGLIVTIFISTYTNIRVIQADIAFKLADPFTGGTQWPVAIQIYKRANTLAPIEDYYYLFLGRAYLEYAKLITDQEQQESLIFQAENDLKRAQTINPLNTDHTANLARLNNLWSTYAIDQDEKLAKARASSEYFSKAVILSPKNARLWGEWALLYLNVLEQPEEAREKLLRAQKIDPNYHWTYALTGEMYSQFAHNSSDSAAKENYYRQAIEAYKRAIELPTPGDALAKYNYSLALGATYINLNMLPDAIAAYRQAIELAPTTLAIWRVEESIGILYSKLGDINNATSYVTSAIESAPEDQKDRLQSILNQLQPN